MAMMLGTFGAELVRNFAAQATGEKAPPTKFWGDVIGKNEPHAFTSSRLAFGPVPNTFPANLEP